MEICDFGVAGILQTQRDKRSTWIGTPHWMPPEMFATRGAAHQYGSEVRLCLWSLLLVFLLIISRLTYGLLAVRYLNLPRGIPLTRAFVSECRLGAS